MSDWHEAYRRRYADLKAKGKSFFPYTVFKDTLVALLVLGLLSWLSLHYGAGLEDPADPTDTTYNPRPEWYFLFMFQSLKYFPGKVEALGIVGIPVFLGLALLAPVFLDRGPERHPLDRLRFTVPAVGLMGVIAWLTYAAYQSPMLNPAEEKNPAVIAGQKLFADMRCAYCHSIGGKGGDIGPSLDHVGGRKTPEWLTKHFRDPKSVTPGSLMPKLNLLDDEVANLVAYMKSLGGGEPYTDEAPKLFAANCAVCHKIGKEGGEVGPDLSLIGSARDKAYIKRYVKDPSKVNPSASMPSFNGQLTDVQLEDLARYLSSLGR
jgi:mono/diheme cytochrome c family protein